MKKIKKQNMELRLNLKKVLREMEGKDITVATLAKAIGATPRSIYFILDRRTTTLKTIDKIASVLEVDPKDLLITV